MNTYNVDISEQNIRAPLVSLNILYKEIPETHGCENCHDVNKENAQWCCKLNNPSMYYVEFLNVYEQVQKWNKEKRKQLIFRAICNYLSNKSNKGCIFFNNECICYEHRPLACRHYGIISKDSWDNRINLLKNRDPSFQEQSQCDLVKIKDSNETLSQEEESKHFEHTQKCEKRIGVTNTVINKHDLAGGSYRTFHDHLLIELFSDKCLNTLSLIRMSNPSSDDIKKFVDILDDSVS